MLQRECVGYAFATTVCPHHTWFVTAHPTSRARFVESRSTITRSYTQTTRVNLNRRAAPAAEPAAEGKPVGGAALHVPDGSRHDGSRRDPIPTTDADGSRSNHVDGSRPPTTVDGSRQNDDDGSRPGGSRPSDDDGSRQDTTDAQHADGTRPVDDDAIRPTDVDAIRHADDDATRPTDKTALSVRGSTVFLCTAMVPIITAYGHIVTLRTMFDTGSQVDLISERGAREIGHELHGESITLQGVGGGKVETSKGQLSFNVAMPGGQKTRITCHVMPQVVGKLQRTSLPASFLKQFEGYQLADPTFLKENQIDMLIGMGYFHQFVMQDVVQIGSLYLQQTVFGWAVTGRPEIKKFNRMGTAAVATMTEGVVAVEIHHDSDSHAPGVVNENGLVEFERFWVTEDMPDAPAETKHTPEARFCVKHYDDTTTFDADGRARCSLPFNEGAPKLGNSRAQAIRRFLSLEARLTK